MVRVMHHQNGEDGCEWSTHTLLYAARCGHLECLEYAHTHGCPFNASGLAIGNVDVSIPVYLTTQAVNVSSMTCLAYVRKAMGCTWDPEGSECKVAFQEGNLELLQYIHSHGGVLCTQFELLCPHSDWWLDDERVNINRKAMCLLYVLSYGGCQVKGIWHTKVGKAALKKIKARRVAVLLSFHASNKRHVRDSRTAAAHAAMQRMPSHLVWEVICAAGLQVVE